jgi:hypothetical protein
MRTRFVPLPPRRGADGRGNGPACKKSEADRPTPNLKKLQELRPKRHLSSDGSDGCLRILWGRKGPRSAGGGRAAGNVWNQDPDPERPAADRPHRPTTTVLPDLTRDVVWGNASDG